MASLLRRIRKLNGLTNRSITEPFAGGAGASLALLFLEDTEEIFINDADRSIYDFWWAVINQSRSFLDLLAKTPVTISEWRRQRAIYRASGRVSHLQRGFATFFLNRCNRSGIIMGGGPIGGVKQAGTWKLDARFNKPELRVRCERLAEYRNRIHLTSNDGLEVLSSATNESTVFFIDPPYFIKGKTLYMNGLDENYHKALASQLRSMRDAAWVLTYDDCPYIRRIYQGWSTIHPFSLRYSAAKRREGHEVLIVPKWISLPGGDFLANRN